MVMIIHVYYFAHNQQPAFKLTFSDFRDLRQARNKISNLNQMLEKKMVLRQRRVFFQFFITTIWLLIFDVPFILMSFLPVTPVYGFCVTMAYTINCSINGWVYFSLNRGIRKAILGLFTCTPKTRSRTESDLRDDNFVANAIVVASPAVLRRTGSDLDTIMGVRTQIVNSYSAR